MKRISAVIVNWNDKETLARCIRSLQQQTHGDIEIIVSDNASSDGSQAMVKEQFHETFLIENPDNLGFGTAVNRGFERASGDYLIFLNNDLEFAPDSFAILVDALESVPGIGAVIPKILYSQKQNAINSLGVNIHCTGIAYPRMLDEPDCDDLAPEEVACGGIFMMRREVYEELGGFDEDLFLYHEDHDLSWRIRLAGWRLLTNPRAVFHHRYHFNKGKMKYYHSEKNRLHLLLKYLELKSLVLLAPPLLLVELAQWAHSLMHGWFFLKLKSYGDLLDLLPRILVKRRRLQSRRAVADREIARLFSSDLQISGVQSLALDFFLNPLLKAYWLWIRRYL
ncbi:MAG: glycosyltransferase family 2 protein [Candidatus Nitrohelix vancouverensis]|uniref:Glycosyltransferase family 2 protein n=1 Tax=Candidatus Nitrohelix vancouverensis TaxID=2705534 RepID=A0A7T0C2A7_9BACT|nr:MAG: glycosyltransferase family 2 protein [Candidatus Nitrohelix vancouverensis]